MNKKENKKKENVIKYWYYKNDFNYKMYSFIKIYKMYPTIVSTAIIFIVKILSINLHSKNIDSMKIIVIYKM